MTLFFADEGIFIFPVPPEDCRSSLAIESRVCMDSVPESRKRRSCRGYLAYVLSIAGFSGPCAMSMMQAVVSQSISLRYSFQSPLHFTTLGTSSGISGQSVAISPCRTSPAQCSLWIPARPSSARDNGGDGRVAASSGRSKARADIGFLSWTGGERRSFEQAGDGDGAPLREFACPTKITFDSVQTPRLTFAPVSPASLPVGPL